MILLGLFRKKEAIVARTSRNEAYAEFPDGTMVRITGLRGKRGRLVVELKSFSSGPERRKR